MPRAHWSAVVAPRLRVMNSHAYVTVCSACSSFIFNPARTRIDPAAAGVRHLHRCAGNSIVTRLFEFLRRVSRDNREASVAYRCAPPPLPWAEPHTPVHDKVFAALFSA